MYDESQSSLPLDVMPRTPQLGFTLSKQPVLPDCRKIEKINGHGSNGWWAKTMFYQNVNKYTMHSISEGLDFVRGVRPQTQGVNLLRGGTFELRGGAADGGGCASEIDGGSGARSTIRGGDAYLAGTSERTVNLSHN